MKKLLLVVVILSIGIFAHAQKGSPEARAQEKVAKLGEQLDLTDEQEEQIVALFVEQFQNRKGNGKKLGELTKEERDAFIQAKKDQRAAFDKELEGILTSEQLATYQAKKGKSKGKDKKGKHSSSQRKADKLAETLGLNAEQKAAVVSALEEQQAARGNQSFEGKTKEEKKAAMEARKAARTALDSTFKTIFTAEQYATYQQQKEEKKQKMEKDRAATRADMIEKKLNHLSEALSLTTEQKAQVSDLLSAQHAAKPVKSAKKDRTPESRAANKEQRKAAKSDFDAKMKEILSAEQYASFQELQDGRQGKDRKRGGKRRR